MSEAFMAYLTGPGNQCGCIFLLGGRDTVIVDFRARGRNQVQERGKVRRLDKVVINARFRGPPDMFFLPVAAQRDQHRSLARTRLAQ